VEGKVEGKAEDIVTVLKVSGVAITPRQEERISLCRDAALLSRWLVRALKVTTAAELFDEDAGA
jgi:hypothetical protein